MLSARDFFYEVILGTSEKASYAKMNQSGLLNEPAKWLQARNQLFERYSKKELKKLRAEYALVAEHKPLLSNDPLLEFLMDELIDAAPDEFRGRLEKMFVAKLRTFAANAGARVNRDEYEGDLIFFNVGLSDACYQYMIAFNELVGLLALRSRLDDSNRRVVALARQLERHVLFLASAQNRWNRRREVRVTEADIVTSSAKLDDQAASVSVCADVFILYHEICHHLLEHTRHEELHLGFIEDLPASCKGWIGIENDSHRREFQADAGAVLLALSMWSGDAKRQANMELRIALGSLFALTVIGQFVPDVSKSSASHPSVIDRFDRIAAILRAKCKFEKQRLEGIIDDIGRFQLLISKAQRRGLGLRLRVSDFG